jgi:glycosyltransferase involved in cell wall biosynthesis
LAQLRIARLCEKINAKIISDATEWYDASAGGLLYRIVKSGDTFLRMKVAHTSADGVITTSKYLTEFYKKRNKVVVNIPTLFDVDRFQHPPPRKNIRSIRFIYVGNPFNQTKVNKHLSNIKERLDVCVEIFQEMHKEGKAFSFDVYGISQQDYLEVFPEHKEILHQMENCVFFRGWQPNQYVADRIADSDFSIFFRDQTRVTMAGFPSKLAESISCGTPVICNSADAARYTGTAEKNLFLASRGQELALVRSVFQYSSSELDELKSRAYFSRAYDYRSYVGKVADFLSRIGV